MLIWKGHVNLSDVKINLNSNYFSLGHKYNSEIETYFRKLKKVYPHITDGVVSWINDFQVTKKHITLEVSPIQYSEVRYIWANRDQFNALFKGIKGFSP